MKRQKNATLTLIRGLPGAGKSTLAQLMLERGEADCHFEADMWVNYDLPYKDRNIPAAHKACQAATRAALKKGRRVVVANTFTRRRAHS